MSFDGLMNNIMTVQRREVAVSSIGSDTEIWDTWIADWPCRVQPVSGSERFSLARYNVQVSHIIYCRWCAITEVDRIVFDGRTFEVRMVRDIDEQASFLTILAQELK